MLLLSMKSYPLHKHKFRSSVLISAILALSSGLSALLIILLKVTLLDLRITLPTSLYFVIMSSTSSRSQLLTPTWIITSFGSSFIKSLNLPVTSSTFSPPLLLTRTLTSLLESFSYSILCSCESPTTITLSLPSC